MNKFFATILLTLFISSCAQMSNKTPALISENSVSTPSRFPADVTNNYKFKKCFIKEISQDFSAYGKSEGEAKSKAESNCESEMKLRNAKSIKCTVQGEPSCTESYLEHRTICLPDCTYVKCYSYNAYVVGSAQVIDTAPAGTDPLKWACDKIKYCIVNGTIEIDQTVNETLDKVCK